MSVKKTRRPGRPTTGSPLPEIVIGTAALTKRISREARAGRVRKIGPRLYTSNLRDDPADIIRRNVWVVVGQLFPGTVVSHRTALEGRPGAGGDVFLTGTYARTMRLPGITVHQARGAAALEGDTPFLGTLILASRARALLEAMRAGRRRGSRRGISDVEAQERLERLLQTGGEDALNALRDQARRLAQVLDAEGAFRRLDELVGTLLGTRRGAVSAPALLARLAGHPYDPARLPLFEALFAELRERAPLGRSDTNTSDDSWRHHAFLDAYFSNYIEGTEFEIGEALAIVFDGQIPAVRPKDAHDVLGTFRLLSNRDLMRRSVADGDAQAFVRRLQDLHGRMLAERPEVRPGALKIEPNRAGDTHFVAPDLVIGTLHQGFGVMRALDDPFSRAAFVMFLVAEVHPFTDGNGRLARVVMNAELAASGQARIIIPTVYRDDYLEALRALSRRERPAPLVAMLDRAQRFGFELDCSVLPRVLEVLTACDAFKEPREGRLRLPSAVERRAP